ncbi:MAG: hypothetical protein HYW25_04020 [Candidatus Aenigmarchaeota archaeon]|nr:hypothetical protein [Candidatus Aenigmarchaeota archaeon]
MSWGDQILDELGLVDLKNRKSVSKLDKDKLNLYVFALWLAKKHKLKISDEELEKEIEEFLKEQE